ncbi:MAG: hypothetical protein JRI72_00375 [Deltaproteobacteria bacterium]|nr:hypothetical protein [Deltaproteobacteria bacterium]
MLGSTRIQYELKEKLKEIAELKRHLSKYNPDSSAIRNGRKGFGISHDPKATPINHKN